MKRAGSERRRVRRDGSGEAWAGRPRKAGSAKGVGEPEPMGMEQDGRAAVEGIERGMEPQLAAGGSRRWLYEVVPSWLTSFVVHFVLVLLLAFLSVPGPEPQVAVSVMEIDEAMAEPEEPVLNEKLDPTEVQELEDAPVSLDVDPTPLDDAIDTQFEDTEAASAIPIDLSVTSRFGLPKHGLSMSLGDSSGSGFQGRRGAARSAMVRRYGGSAGSEAAVAQGLKWLAAHQMPDGGWSLDHRQRACKGFCKNPGSLEARNAATALALLPFLGAGQTHLEGRYKQTVERGLAFLVRRQKVRNRMGDWRDDGSMYSHGLATIAICEGYAMTRDAKLARPAQLAVNFIVNAQEPQFGGWRYRPRQPGDTSVTGWQIMALKSGHMAYLVVPRDTVTRAERFLRAVSTRGGARYGYVSPGGGPSTTAIGLLCRMYLGWKHDNEALKQGVDYLSKIGPTDNLYYDYYAAQVMRHYGGAPWKKWNARTRDWLIKRQAKKGHAAGSWYINGAHAEKGGRLYCTSLATMILEVYYRHLPLYEKSATEGGFKE